MATPSKLFLLADHIKLSLLERQRAIALNLEPNTQDGHISRSLESMREGVEAVEKEGDRDSNETISDQASRLRRQYDDLVSEFHGFPSSHQTSTLSQPNDPSLAADFSHAASTTTNNTDPSGSRPRLPSSSSFKRTSPSPQPGSKSVRFSDSPASKSRYRDADEPDEEESRTRSELFPYHDEPPEVQGPDHAELSNQQIHAYHTNVLADQDEQLDRLGESIGRQRELTIQIGDELDSHVQLLDDVDEHVDRHQTRLDGAKKRLGTIARKAKDNMQLTIIAILIIILVLLIVILK